MRCEFSKKLRPFVGCDPFLLSTCMLSRGEQKLKIVRMPSLDRMFPCSLGVFFSKAMSAGIV